MITVFKKEAKNKKDRISRIKENIPKRFFFEKDFLVSSRIKTITADIDLSNPKTDEGNILNCSPVLKKDQEYKLFRKYNYFRYKILKSTNGIVKNKKKKIWPKPSNPVCLDRLGDKSLKQIEKYISEMENVRNIILKSNMRLVFTNVNKMCAGNTFENQDYFTNGYYHLLKAIDCFDYTQGFKFSTYATWVLRRNLYRDKSYSLKHDGRLCLNEEEIIDKKSDFDFSEANLSYNKDFIKKMFKKIKNSKMNNPEAKIKILSDYFGIGGSDRKTLEQIGNELSLSKERIRQIKSNLLVYLSENMTYDPLC